jgi:hypothetical protein
MILRDATARSLQHGTLILSQHIPIQEAFSAIFGFGSGDREFTGFRFARDAAKGMIEI